VVSSGRITTTVLANWNPDMWDTDTLDAIQFATLLYDSVDTHLENILKMGDVANVPRKSNLTTQTKSANTDVTFEQPGPSAVEGVQTVTVATQEYAAIYVEDLEEAQAFVGVRSKYTEGMGYTLARGLDVSIAAQFQNLSQIVGTLGVEITDDNLLDAWRQLEAAGAPGTSTFNNRPDRFLALPPRAIAGLMKIDKFVNQLYVGNSSEEQIKQGVPLRKIYGAALLESNLLRAASAGQADGAMYHRNEYYVIRQGKPATIALHNPAGIGWQVVSHNFYGLAEVNRPPETPGGGTAVDTWGVLLRTLQ
jgi:hypothetical protein